MTGTTTSLVRLANEKTFEAADNLSVLDAARAAGIVLEHSCRTGRCGTCKARVLEGTTRSIGDESGLPAPDRAAGYVLTCTSAATSPLRLDIEDVGALANYPVRTLPCRVDAIAMLAPDVMQVMLRFPPNSNLRYLPGQYVDVIATGGLRRSYSIANMPAASGKVELHIRRVPQGAMSDYWFDRCKAGDLLRIEGPKGTFFLRDVAGLDLVFLATGTGIAPIKALLDELTTRPAPTRPRSVQLYWGGRVETDLYWQPEVDASDVRYVPVLSRATQAWAGERGHVQHALLRRHSNLAETAVYACGSSEMIDGARATLVDAGLASRRFLSDAFVSSK